MNSFKLFRLVFCAALALGFSAPGSRAQTLALNVTVVTNAATPTELSFVVAFTNRLAAPIVNVRMTNVLDGAAGINSNILNIDDLPPGTDIRNQRFPTATPPRVETEIPFLAANSVVRLTITIPRPTDLAAVSDNVSVWVGAEQFTDSARADEAASSGGGGGGGGGTTRSAGDLSVSFVIPPNSNPIQGDFFDLGIIATNRGPGAVSDIIITNIFDGLVIRGVTPTQALAVNANGEVPVTVGTLQPNTAVQFTFNLTTTNSRTFNLTSTIGSASNDDPGAAANNSADFPLAVAATNSPNVTVSIGAAQQSTPNLQTGLFTESVNVRNDSGATIPAFRLNVYGMNATNILYNAQGTNSGIPYVVFPHPLPPGKTTNVVLEFFNSRRRPVPTTSTNYFVTQLLNYSATNTAATTTNIFTWVTATPSGPLVQFPATVGNRYTIVYSDNPQFTNNVFRAQPSFIAPGNIVQWYDTGPPKTLSTDGTTTRFYRVLEGQ